MLSFRELIDRLNDSAVCFERRRAMRWFVKLIQTGRSNPDDVNAICEFLSRNNLLPKVVKIVLLSDPNGRHGRRECFAVFYYAEKELE